MSNYIKKSTPVRAWFWTGMKADYDSAPKWVAEVSEFRNGTLRIENENRVYLLHPRHWMIQVEGTKGAYPCTKVVFEQDYEKIGE